MPLGGRRQWSGAVVPMRHISRGTGWDRCPSSQSYIQSKCRPRSTSHNHTTKPTCAAPRLRRARRTTPIGPKPTRTPRAEPDARTLLTVLRGTDAPDGCPRPRLKQTQTTLLSTNRLRNPPSASPRASGFAKSSNLRSCPTQSPTWHLDLRGPGGWFSHRISGEPDDGGATYSSMPTARELGEN